MDIYPQHTNIAQGNLNKSDVERSTVWTPTCILRWKTKDIPFDVINKTKVLQQMWQGDAGEQEWRDIEIAE
jgi:hypothetical protein